jgi:hypothetical protein
MKRINHMQRRIASSSNSANRTDGVLEYGSVGVLRLRALHHAVIGYESGRARVSASRENVPQPKAVFSSAIKIGTRLRQQSGSCRTRTRSLPLVACVFYGLSLDLSARTVINNETVLPKAVRTAGIMLPRLNSGVASADYPRRAATISLERRVVSKQ